MGPVSVKTSVGLGGRGSEGPAGQVWRWEFNLEAVRSQGAWGRAVSSLQARGRRVAGRGRGAQPAARPGGMEVARWEG